MLSFVFLAWFSSHFTPRRAIRCDLALLACTRGVRGAESRAEQQRVALLTRYPTRTRRPLWPSCERAGSLSVAVGPETSRPTVRRGGGTGVRRPRAALPHAMRHVSSRQHDKEIPRSVHASYLQYVSLSLLVNFVLQWYYNYNDKKWTMLGTGDMPGFFFEQRYAVFKR